MRAYRKGIGIGILVLTVMLSCAARNSEAQDVYPSPSKPITIIIAFSPGASLDVTTRALAPYLSQYLKTNIVITNIPGSGGDIGHYKAYTAKPDGYTLLAWNTLSPLLSEYMHEVKYKTLAFTPIAAISRDCSILLGHPDGFNNVTEFIKQAKTRRVNIGNNGQFTINGFQGRLMAQELGMKVNWVNYGGTAEAMGALAGKHLDAATNLSAAATSLVKAGKIVPLLMFAKNRLPQFPDVPVPGELGLEVPLLGSSLGIVGPPGMDKDKVKVLENAIMKASTNRDFIAWMEKASTAERIFMPADPYRKELERQGRIAERYKNIFAKE